MSEPLIYTKRDTVLWINGECLANWDIVIFIDGKYHSHWHENFLASDLAYIAKEIYSTAYAQGRADALAEFEKRQQKREEL